MKETDADLYRTIRELRGQAQAEGVRAMRLSLEVLDLKERLTRMQALANTCLLFAKCPSAPTFCNCAAHRALAKYLREEPSTERR